MIVISPPIAAFLALIRHSEGTDKAPNPWAVTFGYQFTITDFSDHPYLTGAWQGAHWSGGFTTAARAYQINVPTWRDFQPRLQLPDFSALSQDQCAVAIVERAGALDSLNADDIAGAIMKCARRWASFPGSDSGQPHARLTSLLTFYQGAIDA